jgi:hypothetical protein
MIGAGAHSHDDLSSFGTLLRCLNNNEVKHMNTTPTP